MVTFDTLKIALPLEHCSLVSRSNFVPSKDPNILKLADILRPVGYSFVQIDTIKNDLVIECSAKLLKDDYYQSLNINNFTRIVEGLNHVVIVPTDVLYNMAMVYKCDVTDNIDISDYPYTKRDTINTIALLKSNANYKTDIWDKKNNNGIFFISKSSDKRDIIKFYDKKLDLEKRSNSNKKFIASLKNAEQIFNQFNNVVRVESSISDWESIRKGLNVPNNYLSSVLSSCEPVNRNKLLKICSHKPNKIIDLTDKIHNVYSDKFKYSDIVFYIHAFEYNNYDFELVKTFITEKQQWSKSDWYKRWTLKGLKDLFFDAKILKQGIVYGNSYEIFNNMVNKLSEKYIHNYSEVI